MSTPGPNPALNPAPAPAPPGARPAVELLAPAGDWEAMRAAVANGSHAMYFGLPQYPP